MCFCLRLYGDLHCLELRNSKILKYSRKFSPWSSYPCGCCGASKCPCWWPLPLWIWCWWETGLGLLWSEIEKTKLNRIRFLNSTSGCLEYKPSRGRERQYFRITLVDFIKKWSKNWVWFKLKSTLKSKAMGLNNDVELQLTCSC